MHITVDYYNNESYRFLLTTNSFTLIFHAILKTQTLLINSIRIYKVI